MGDKRRNKRAVEIAAMMAARPEASLPSQMEDRSALKGAYDLLNNEEVTMEGLLSPTCKLTLAAASCSSLVLMVEDTTELDYTAHREMKGIAQIGDGRGRGLLLHSTLAVVPQGRQVLGLAHAQVVLRQPASKHWTGSPEAQVWEVSAQAVGRPPAGVTWVHVSDKGSDDFGYLAECVDQGKDFVVRAFHNRVLHWDDEAPQAQAKEAHALLDYVRSRPPEPGAGYPLQLHAHQKQPARQAQVVLSWTPVTLPPPVQGPPEQRSHAPIPTWVVRVWEPDPPPEVAEPVEWVLVTTLAVETVEDAYRIVDYYTCRWLCEDYHQCLKTGCRVEQSQLDDGADIRRLLGFTIPIAVRLLQIRQVARQTPEIQAVAVVEPLMVTMLVLRQKKGEQTMTIGAFWQGVARLGGHQGRRSDGPPGWRTLWQGWCKLADLTAGARLYVNNRSV